MIYANRTHVVQTPVVNQVMTGQIEKDPYVLVQKDTRVIHSEVVHQPSVLWTIIVQMTNIASIISMYYAFNVYHSNFVSNVLYYMYDSIYSCVNPCHGQCGAGGVCNARRHVAVCTCQEGYAGDALNNCYDTKVDPPRSGRYFQFRYYN